jgi:hypothetical protein
MRIIVGLAAALLWATPAVATDWYWVETSEDQTTVIFIDRDSIQNMGMKMRRASVFFVPSEPEGDGAAGYQSTLEYDCADPRYRFIDIRSLDMDGKVFATFPGTGIWRDILPDTLDDSARKFVCSGGEEPGDVRSYGAEIPLAAGRALLSDKPAD